MEIERGLECKKEIRSENKGDQNKVLMDEQVVVLEPLDWEKINQILSEKGEVIKIEPSNSISFNPLDPEPNEGGNYQLTISDLIGPWGEIKSYEEVTKNIDVPYDVWENAANFLKEINRLIS